MIEHEAVRTVLIPAVLEIVCESKGLQPQEALKLFYESKLAVALGDEETGLYGQSPLALSGMFLEELERKHI